MSDVECGCMQRHPTLDIRQTKERERWKSTSPVLAITCDEGSVDPRDLGFGIAGAHAFLELDVLHLVDRLHRLTVGTA